MYRGCFNPPGFYPGNIIDLSFPSHLCFTSDIVADEVSRSYSHGELETLGLRIIELEGEQVLEIDTLQRKHIELSPNDLSVYSPSTPAVTSLLISGDGPLRELADTNRVEYHRYLLWILEEMIARGILLPSDVAATAPDHARQ